MSSPLLPTAELPKRWNIPSIVQQSDEGLAGVSQEVLEERLQPIRQELSQIDVQELLNLEQVDQGTPGAVRLRNGYVLHTRDKYKLLKVQVVHNPCYFCSETRRVLICTLIFFHSVYARPIHDEITPSCTGACVRYVHISEVPGQYSMGIFIFPPNAKIPLHDHPGMCVLSRVLYGGLERLSLDLGPVPLGDDAGKKEINASVNSADDDDNAMQVDQAPMKKSTSFTNLSKSWLPAWVGGASAIRHNRSDSPVSSNSSSGSAAATVPDSFPAGTKLAYKHHTDVLQAPDTTALYPLEGNLHEFQAGPTGAAVLDVLLPPYDVDHHRDCTFYDTARNETLPTLEDGREPCWVVPRGQPEDFHCISGTYREIGG